MLKITNEQELTKAYEELDRLWDEYDGSCLNPQIIELEKAIEQYNFCDIRSGRDYGVPELQ